MSNIPEAREELLGLAERLRALDHPAEADRIREIVAQKLTRRSPVKPRTRARNRELTPELAAEIRAFVRSRAGKDMSYADVGTRFQVNSGRVSEAMHGDV